VVSKKKTKEVNILSCVPKGWTPRPNQTIMLEALAANYDKADVFVIDAPVGAGKALTAVTASLYAWKAHGTKAVIATPNNILLRQYDKDFPGTIMTVGRQASYSCVKYEREPRPLNCKRSKELQGSFCKGCPYTTALRKAQAWPVSLHNYHSYMAYKAYRPFVVFDEAHNLASMIASGAAKKLWHHDYHYPHWVKDYKTLYQWASRVVATHTAQSLPPPLKLVELMEELESNRVTRIYSKGTALWRGQEAEAILSSPVDISEEPPIMWPKKVSKLLLMSATFNSRDIKELGLSDRRVCYIPSPSPIPKENRPCYIVPVANMSYWNQEKSLPIVAAWIEEHLRNNPTKGFIHAPYALARKLRNVLGQHPRLLFHDTLDKASVFKEYLATEGTVMVGSGMYEGVSLDGDLARWQIIVKVPWPSLAEPALEYLANNDSEYYANRTIKDIVQCYGRVCRGPEDTGDTYIVDSTFIRLERDYGHLFPSWFKEAIKTSCTQEKSWHLVGKNN
jgi:Rad3-related DNA helicase